jgi:hypothetical protein
MTSSNDDETRAMTQPLHGGDAPACRCGAPLPALVRPGPQPRRYCSTRCRRAAEFRARKVQRREARVEDWRRADPDLYPRAQRRAEIAQLRAEIRALEQGAPSLPSSPRSQEMP